MRTESRCPIPQTEVRQYGAVFRLNFGEVYWNSRLEPEHKRHARPARPRIAVAGTVHRPRPLPTP